MLTQVTPVGTTQVTAGISEPYFLMLLCLSEQWEQ